MEKLKIKINSALRGYKPGTIIEIKANSDGVPADGYWRRRLKDAKIDNCVELVEDPPPKPAKPKKIKSEEE